MLAISAASWPIGQGPNDSPRSELRSILILFLTDHFSRQYALSVKLRLGLILARMKLLRTVIFWIHLAAGATAGVVILVMSVTGVALTYEKQLIERADRRSWSAPSSTDARHLPPETLLAKVAEARPGTAPVAITLRSDPAAPATVTLEGNKTLLVDPYTARDHRRAAGQPRAFFRTMTVWHRYLALEGASRSDRQDDHRRGQPRVPLHRAERPLPVAAEGLDLDPIQERAVVSPRPVRQGARLQLAQHDRILVRACRWRSSSPARSRSRIPGPATWSIASWGMLPPAPLSSPAQPLRSQAPRFLTPSV